MSVTIEDCVHGDIQLPGYVVPFIESKEFKRLMNLKQLGVSNFVFPSATHSRKEHCIGTAYLCSSLLKILENNSQIKIDELHKKCVILAGLLHDIGHGPYSHLWEGVVHQGTDKNWTHEDQSLKLIEHLITTNDIKLHDDLKTHRNAVRLMTSLITGNCETWKEMLAPEEFFITEIVSNKLCNIDVDKLDYLIRDHYHVKEHVKTLKPFMAFLKNARVVNDGNGTSHIGYNSDDFELIENMFWNRANFHMNIYQNLKVIGVERMVRDICVHGAVGGVTIDNLKLTDAHQNCDAYVHLDDSVLDLIKNSGMKNASVLKAQEILQDLQESRYYRYVCDDPSLIEILVAKFGAIFCIIDKVIPNAEVPSNIPLYNGSSELVSMKSDDSLGYKASMIYSVESDEVTFDNIKNFIDVLNNNV